MTTRGDTTMTRVLAILIAAFFTTGLMMGASGTVQPAAAQEQTVKDKAKAKIKAKAKAKAEEKAKSAIAKRKKKKAASE
jgi:preprotein translocase subunit SecG